VGALGVSVESVSSEITVASSPDRILDVLCDFEGYPGWARSIKEARVVERSPDGRASQVEFRVGAGPLGKLRYVLRYSYSPAGLAWDYVEGDLKDIRGSYELVSTDGETRVVYHLAIDPGLIPMPGFVKARAAREITKTALKDLKKHVEDG
jgi:hypothetical protein